MVEDTLSIERLPSDLLWENPAANRGGIFANCHKAKTPLRRGGFDSGRTAHRISGTSSTVSLPPLDGCLTRKVEQGNAPLIIFALMPRFSKRARGTIAFPIVQKAILKRTKTCGTLFDPTPVNHLPVCGCRWMKRPICPS